MHKYLKNGLGGAVVVLCLMALQTAFAAIPAGIRVLPVSPRLRDASTSDVYDVKSTGINVVGVNQRIYLVPDPDASYATSITNYVWSIPTQPSPGAAVVDYNTSGLLKFHPSAGGVYTVQMIPYVSGAASTPTTQQVVAAQYVGSGKEGSNVPAYPQCGMGCHTGNVNDWWGTNHARKLENTLNHKYGTSYKASCLECHTLGYDKIATGNNNFYEKAQALAFNLNQIVTWVADPTTSHWPDLPAQLQLKSNIQCEQCHGPGSNHGGDITRIDHGDYSGGVCDQCHDAGTHHTKPYQWRQSKHSGALTDSAWKTSTNCQKCHTAEGFVAMTVGGGTSIPSEVTSRNNVTCIACHDPHSAANDCQLRKISAVRLPNFFMYDGGLGNLCANCHNSRISNVANTVATSNRGAHRSPVADVMLGTSAYEWGTSYPASLSPHYTTTTDTCVSCHMAPNPGGDQMSPVGGHTYAIDTGTTNNVTNACAGCHTGLTTTDRLPLVAVDYDGDGATSGIQTEVSHLLANLRAPLLLLTGTTYSSDTERISITSGGFSGLSLNVKGALYNYNLCASERSHGVHNGRYVIAVLQRSYFYATGHYYKQDYPLSTTLDSGDVSVAGGPLNFGSQDVNLGPTAPQSVTIWNNGLSVLSFTGAGLALTGANADQFAIVGSPATTPLLPGTSRTVQVAFDPFRAGAQAAALTITTDDPASPTVNVALTGTGTGSGLASVAGIAIQAVSPRLRDQATSDVYDVKSSGLDVVGINQRVYLVPDPNATYATSMTAYAWSVLSEPSPGAAVIDSNTSGLLKLHPSAAGEYQIQLIPTVLGMPSTPTVQRLYAAQYVGTGKEVAAPPPSVQQCGFGCHTDKVTSWLGTRHGHKLENHLNHKYGTHYAVSCLECHTLGYDTVSTGNNNFYEKAQATAFDLNQIATWVADTTTSHWPDLPGALRIKSNIQCESCHGPGNSHMGDTTKIAAGQYSGDVCRQCHDSASGYQQKVWQWDRSKHSGPADPHMATNPGCVKCHTAEGFVAITVDGGSAIPSDVTTRNHITCVACHDPHDASNPSELRKVTAVTLPNGSVFDGGLGNVCANCHNSRIANPLTTINTSYRGAHHGPMADILLGKSAYDWGTRYPAGASPHYSSGGDTCVQCHMAAAPAGANPAAMGSHTFTIDAGTTQNVQAACGSCHPGLTTTDRLPLVPVDYDGDGATSGIQTEVSHLLDNVKAKLLLLPGTTWSDAEHKITISSSDYNALPFNSKAALYNFNLCSEEKSEGVHNSRYVIAVLQRSYGYLTGHPYQQDYPQALILDQPAVSATAGPLAFGGRDVLAGATAPQSVTVQNNGTTSLTFTGAGFSLAGANAGEFVIVGSPLTTPLGSGTSRTVNVAFDPSTAGPKNASLRITSNDPATSVVSVTLSGTGLDREITVAPLSHPFGNQLITGGSSAPRTVSISNVGNAPLNFAGAGIALTGSHPGEFLITNSPSILPIAPGTTRTVTLVFDPSSVGAKNAILRLTTDDANEATVDVALSGTGTQRVASVTPLSLPSFGNQPIAAGRTAVKNVAIQNTGNAPLSFTGAGIALTGVHANQFAITNNPAKTTLNPGQSRTVSVAFDPSATGAKGAALTFTTNDPANPTISVGLGGTGTAPVIGTTPSALSFAARKTNSGPSAAKTVTIQNTGTAPLNFTGIALAGTHPTQFAITNNPALTPLQPGQSRIVSVVFNPTTVGAKSAALRITTDDAARPTLNVNLAGTGGVSTAVEHWIQYR